MQDLGMAEMFYALWYEKDVSPNLTRKQKEELLQKLSKLSLEDPIFLQGKFDKEKFPELKPYAHTNTLSGKQLYVLMNEIFNELYPGVERPVSYPHFPSKGKLKS
jgi:hypothetical protein